MTGRNATMWHITCFAKYMRKENFYKGRKMNISINKNNPFYSLEDQKEPDVESVWEIIAISLVLFITASYLLISIWSAVLLLSANAESVGPIGYICQLIHPK